MTSTQLYKLVLTTLLLFSLGVFGVRGQKEDSSSACKKILAAVSKKINSIPVLHAKAQECRTIAVDAILRATRNALWNNGRDTLVSIGRVGAVPHS